MEQGADISYTETFWRLGTSVSGCFNRATNSGPMNPQNYYFIFKDAEKAQSLALAKAGNY